MKSKQYYIRKSHRWLGLLLGIQFLFWTLGGLYFSWINLDEVHGDFEKKTVPVFASSLNLVSPKVALDSLAKRHPIDSLVSIQLITVMNRPIYQLVCKSASQTKLAVQKGHENHDQSASMVHLVDALTAKLRGPLNREEAIQVAKDHVNGPGQIGTINYLTEVGSHHEYRGGPLPAYAISFQHASHLTVYVATELGTIQKFRNSKWRVFDFLWMLHTMDYENRDHIGNWLLRIFSLFGLITIFSGFLLFFSTRKRKKVN